MCMLSENKFNCFWQQLIRLSNKIKELENRAYTIRGEKLYPVEVHVLLEIFQNPKIGVVRLASNSGVTKGAVSQKIKILIERGFIISQKMNANKKVFQLTEKGKEICIIHNAISCEMIKDIYNKFKQLPDEKLDILVDGLSLLNDYFDTYDVKSTILQIED